MKRKPLVIDKDWCIVAVMLFVPWVMITVGFIKWWNS